MRSAEVREKLIKRQAPFWVTVAAVVALALPASADAGARCRVVPGIYSFPTIAQLRAHGMPCYVANEVMDEIQRHWYHRHRWPRRVKDRAHKVYRCRYRGALDRRGDDYLKVRCTHPGRVTTANLYS